MSVFANIGASLGGAGALGTLFIRLTANASDLIRGMDQAEDKIERSAAVMAKRVAQMGAVVGAAFAGVGVLALREFIAFESSFAGVKKTIDATEEEYAGLASTFRMMAKEGSASIHDINAVAEAAGSLGIERQNLKEFTKVMIDMGTSTNLAADQAATEMARFANITGMSQKDFSRLGSTLVDLGNKLASTEAEIMSMGLRLAGAGTQVGMAEHEILALAGALSSVGVEAEAGGTAMSQAMIKMAMAVKQGSEELKVFAEVAGMSEEEFKKAFAEDAANTILEFTKGLDRLRASGEDVFTILGQMGMDGTRLIDVMTRSAGAQKLFNDALKIGKQAWQDNNALQIEAAKRAETLESQLKQTNNIVRDLLISMGEGLAPAVRGLNKDIQDATLSSSKLNEEMRQMGEMMGNTLSFLLKTGKMIVSGLMMAFKLIGVTFLENAAFILMGLEKIRSGAAVAANAVAEAFTDAFNVLIRGANWLLEKIPDPVWKLLGFKPSDKKNIIPEINFDPIIEDTEILRDAVDVLQIAANDLRTDLEKLSIPQVELKRSTEEVRAAMEKQVTYSQEELKLLEAQASLMDQMAEKKVHLLGESNADEIFSQYQEQKRAFDELTRPGTGKQMMLQGAQQFGGPGVSEAARVKQDQMMLEAEFDKTMEILNKQYEEEQELTREQEEEKLAILKAYQYQREALRRAEYELAINSAETMFGDLASIAAAFAGKQSGIYKAMFAASKAFAIAEAIVKIQQGIAGAAALPWPANLAAMASVVAATSSIVSSIQSVKLEFGGKRERGGPVVSNRAFLVGEKGPELFVPRSAGEIVPNGVLSGGGEVKIIVNNYSDAKVEATSHRDEDGNTIIEMAVRRAKGEIAGEISENRGEVSRALERSYGNIRRGTKQ